MLYKPDEKLIEMIREARVGETINPRDLPYQKFCKEYGVEVAGMQSSGDVDESSMACYDHIKNVIHLRTMNTFLLCHELMHVVQHTFAKEQYLLALGDGGVHTKIAYAENEMVADLGGVCLANHEDVSLEAVEEYMRIWNDHCGRYPEWTTQAIYLLPLVDEYIQVILDSELGTPSDETPPETA